MAATTTVYTVFDSVVLRPLPIEEPERAGLPTPMTRGEDGEWNITYADFVSWQERGIFAKVGVARNVGGHSDRH